MRYIPSNLSILTAMQIYQALRYGAWALVSVMLSKSFLMQSEIGRYEQVMMLGTFFSFFWINSIFITLLANYNTKSQNSRDFFFSVFCIFTLFNTLFAIVLYVGQHQVCQLLIGKYELHYFELMLCFFYLNNFSYFIEHIFLLHQKSLQLLLYAAFNLIIQVSFVAIAVFYFQSLQSLFIGLICFAAFKIPIVLYLVYPFCRPFNIQTTKEVLIICMPLVVSFFITGSNEFIDKFMVSHYFDKAMYAQYTYGARELVISTVLSQALTAVCLTAASYDFDAGLSMLKSKSIAYVRILFPIAIVGMFATFYFFPVVFNTNFSMSWAIMNTYFLLLIPRFLFPQVVLNVLGKNNFILIASVFELAFNLLFTFLLFPLLGFIGIALGPLMGLILGKILLIYFCSFYEVPLTKFVFIKEYVLWSIVLVLSYLVSLFIFL